MSKVGWLAVVVALSVGGSASAQDTAARSEITLSSDKPLAFILFNPSGEVGRTRSSALIKMVSDLVERHTDFKVRLYDADEAKGCAGRLGCIVRTVRRDYERENYVLPNGTLAPFSEHLDKLARQNQYAPEYLLVMSNITGGDVDRMSITMVDANKALQFFHDAPRNIENWEREAEARIAEEALVAPPRRGQVSEEYEANKLFENYFLEDVRRRFDDAGHWEPYGKIEIESSIAGAGIELDGITVGTTQAGLTTVNNVRNGEHVIALVHPELDRWESRVVAKRREVVRVTPQLQARASGAAPALRQTVFWGGVGVAAAGVLITTLAITGQDNDVVTYCLDASEGCGGSNFTSLGFNPDAAPTFTDDVNPPGLLFAPLGYSLMITGATWSLTTLLFGEEDEFPWWQLAAGLALGGVSYGLSAIVD